MSSAFRGVAPTSRRTYIAAENFTDYFYTYRAVKDGLKTVGEWGQVTEDYSKCPAGRKLRENGKYLYPMANPDVFQYYVGVYDAETGLSGYIDPNGPLFGEFNTNKPVYLKDNGSDDGASEDNSEGGDQGAPVYTNGIIETFEAGNSNRHVRLTPDGSIEATGTITLNNGFNCGIADMSDGTYDGVRFKYLEINTPAFEYSTSLVFLTNRTIVNAGAVYAAAPLRDGAFNIVSDNGIDTSQINWLIINHSVTP